MSEASKMQDEERERQRKLMLTVCARKCEQAKRGDSDLLRSARADHLMTERILHRYRWVYGVVFASPVVVFLALWICALTDPRIGHRGSATIPAKTPQHVPAKPVEPEPAFEIEEPLDYQGLELS